MTDNLRASEDEAVRKTLTSSYCPPLIREARERQDETLVSRFRGHPLRIADIGCGDGYHGSLFAPTCELYHGFEISPVIAKLAEDRWRREHLTNADIFVGDVADAELTPAFYDLSWCLYFTPGNLRVQSDDLSIYTDAYLDRNPQFIRIVSRFYEALRDGGRLFLTVYKDVPEAEAAQIDFYINTEQHVVTPSGSRFVATAEHFWSARWTKQSMLSNLEACGIDEGRVVFNELNTIAWLVEIVKDGSVSRL